MMEKHLREIRNVTKRLGSLKALLGVSQIDDLDWENISEIIDEISDTLHTATAGLQKAGSSGSDGGSQRQDGCCGGCTHH